MKNCRISGFADEIDINFDVQLNVINELKQKFIEFRSADGICVADMTCNQAQKYKNKMMDADIKVSALGSSIGKINITEEFETHFEKFKHSVELLPIFDTKYLRMFSFIIPKGKQVEEYTNEVMRRIELMVDYAAKKDIVLMHENEKDIYGDSVKRCVELQERFYGDHFKCVFDFANFVQCQQNVLGAYEELKPYIFYVHVKDAEAETGRVVLPGDGDGHVEEILGELDKDEFQGFLSLEPHLVTFDGSERLESNIVGEKTESGIDAYKRAYNRLREFVKGNL